MYKVVIYIFAVLGLLVSPVSSVTAREACASMTNAQMMSQPTATTTADDAMACCEKDKTNAKDKACASNCMAMCGVTLATSPLDIFTSPLRRAALASPIAQARPLATQSPSFTDPPPKLNA